MGKYNLFKFRAVNKYLINSLVNGELYFAHPENLNDPFDCKVDIKKSLFKAISKSNGVDKAFRASVIESAPVQAWLRRSFAAAFAGLGLHLAFTEK